MVSKESYYIKHALHLDCVTVDKNQDTQGEAWSLLILIDCNSTLAGCDKFNCNASIISKEVANYMKAYS